MILDWKEYEATAVKAVEEGIVLLENRNGALPLKENTPVAIYGRIQLHYYKSGTGSGGMVSIHAPVRERPRWLPLCVKIRSFNSRSREGATIKIRAIRRTTLFQFTLP